MLPNSIRKYEYITKYSALIIRTYGSMRFRTKLWTCSVRSFQSWLCSLFRKPAGRLRVAESVGRTQREYSNPKWPHSVRLVEWQTLEKEEAGAKEARGSELCEKEHKYTPWEPMDRPPGGIRKRTQEIGAGIAGAHVSPSSGRSVPCLKIQMVSKNYLT